MSRISILKSSDGPSKSSNRVQFRIPISVKTTLSDYVKGQDNRLYQETVSLIRDNHIVDEDLLTLLKEVRSVVSILDRKVKLFVQVFLLIPWAQRAGAVVEEYQSFLLDLLAAHNYYVDFTFDVLVQNFRQVDSFAGEDDPVPSDHERRVSANIQTVLRDILKVIPLSQELLVEQCKSHYPYARLPAREQELYVGNLLALAKHQPSIRSSLLKVIFAKMILLDVNSPLEEIVAMEEEDDNEEVAAKIQADATSTVTSLMGGPLAKRVGGTGMRHPMANTLDRKMVRLLDYFDSECTQKDTQDNETHCLAIERIKESLSSSSDADDEAHHLETLTNLAEERPIAWTKVRCLFDEVKDAFSRLVLPTYGSHHVQFLMFYLVAGGVLEKKGVERGQQWLKLSDSFVSFLWGRGSSPNAPPVERLAALGYLSSFIARSKLLPIRMIKAVLAEMCSWIHAYISRQDYTEGGSLTRECANRNHSVFNAVCHSLFYVIAFRHMDLSKTSEDIAFLQSLNLSRIVTASLNPLKTCASAIAKRFATAVASLQLAYCATVMEANARDTIPVESVAVTALPTTVDLIFPFDRYILTRSGPYIWPLLLEYQGGVEEEVAAGEEASGDEEFDDFMDESGCGGRRRDVSMSSEVYGTSPGMMDL